MHRPAWIRGTAAIIGWTGVTTVAAIGSWLGLSSVFAVGRPGTSADTVLAGETEPSTVTPTDESDDDTIAPSTRPAEESPDPTPAQEDLNGWTPIGDSAYERTFATDGGTAVVQLRPDNATVVSASPADGYTAATQSSDPARLVVVFYTVDSMVTVDTMWWNGEPYAEVTQS